jgi:stage V sporulation protein R
MPDYTIADLEEWDKRIQAVIAEESLNTFPQEFELCDFNEMIGYEAYAGMPSHYPHWSFGKGFERKETLYNLGIVGLPYEMVINSNPALAYLMRDNTLLLQILTMTHVYAHNDFFKNNLNFSSTQPQYTIEKFKAHADRVRSYIEDPSIGAEKVEWILDAAHALQFQC